MKTIREFFDHKEQDDETTYLYRSSGPALHCCGSLAAGRGTASVFQTVTNTADSGAGSLARGDQRGEQQHRWHDHQLPIGASW